VGANIATEISNFVYDGRPTATDVTLTRDAGGRSIEVPTFVNEFWTSRQRAAHSLHEISYRACFKPQLPRFFIERLTRPGDRVYDPFMGRGTSLVEAALLGRRPAGCDVNPLSRILVEARLEPPTVEQVAARLDSLDGVELPLPLFAGGGERSRADAAPDAVTDEGLSAFYHPETLAQIRALRAYLREREQSGRLDTVDRWIRMVAVNRLTGHSPGFFSVYTLPPNQATSVEAQRKINRKRGQTPPRRDVRAIVIKKTRSLLADCDRDSRERLSRVRPDAPLLVGGAHRTPGLPDASVDLVVTSPPFLDVVDYAGDNWLRGWFCGIDVTAVPITIARRLEDWSEAMRAVFAELFRVVRPAGHVAFEVGEVHGGVVRLEEAVIPVAMEAGFAPEFVLINAQHFTKTANCWGVSNNTRGTNTNRVVLLRRP
jgi:hypothetical protein